MGAKAAALRWRPDVVVVVDVDFASDDPGVDPKKLGGQVKLGGGPVIHRGAGSNQRLFELALEVAAAEGLPYQVKAIPGATSTDAEELMASGQAATLSFSLPLRYMHSALEVVQPDDAEAGALLAAALTRRLSTEWSPERFVPGG
jgi:endoglucanase